MKSLKTAVLLLLFSTTFSACEKDDICVDGNTPLLVIGFYDAEDRKELKEVPTLVVRGDDGSGIERAVIAFTDLSSVSVPLRPYSLSTEFTISRNLTATDTTTVNVDTVSFSYETTEKFVSRACGFVANYDTVVGTFTEGPDAENWIQDIEVIVPLVENSNETHVKIYH